MSSVVTTPIAGSGIGVGEKTQFLKNEYLLMIIFYVLLNTVSLIFAQNIFCGK